MDTNNVLKQNNFQFKKKFGQNFLTDTNLLSAIVNDAGVSAEDEVLEIGPGAGALTKELAKACKKLICYEIDNKLEPILKETLKEFDNVEVIFDDVMKISSEDIKKHFSGPFKIVANLPYYITTPIMFKFLEGDYNVTSFTVMVQKEVAERFTASPSTKSYGTITAQIGVIANSKITRIVNRQMFNPAPNVDSAILNIEIDKNKFEIENPKVLKQLIKASFHMRRKTLYNNLRQNFNLPPEKLKAAIISCNLKENIRGEALSLQEFVTLSNKLDKEIN
jgi:16S rRNA (adenine1518-N6/adenine1519-N6)-dimethyltransferase